MFSCGLHLPTILCQSHHIIMGGGLGLLVYNIKSALPRVYNSRVGAGGQHNYVNIMSHVAITFQLTIMIQSLTQPNIIWI